MQPEITTRAEFDAFLEQNQIVPDILFPQYPDDTQYQWDLPSQTVFSYPQGRGSTVFGNGKLIHMALTLDIPLSLVYEAFGYPDVVISDGDTDVDLIYTKLGMALVLSRNSSLTRTAYIVLASANSQYENYVRFPSGEAVDHSCSAYGTFP